MKTTIKTLFQMGYNKTQIAQILSIDRKTVRKVLTEGPPGEEEADDIAADGLERDGIGQDVQAQVLHPELWT